MNTPAERQQRAIGRPLRNAHWSLPTAIVAAWCLQFAIQSCQRTQTGFAFSLMISTLLITAWTSHLRAQAWLGWRKFAQVAAGTVGDLVRLAVVTLACMVPLALLLPTYSCMTPKAHASVVLLSASTARAQITERAEQAGTLKSAGVGVAVDKQRDTVGSIVTDDGTIMVMGDDPPVMFVLQPTLVAGQVTWRCTGAPEPLMPGSCR